jgi:hypothetical protein
MARMSDPCSPRYFNYNRMLIMYENVIVGASCQAGDNASAVIGRCGKHTWYHSANGQSPTCAGPPSAWLVVLQGLGAMCSQKLVKKFGVGLDGSASLANKPRVFLG